MIIRRCARWIAAKASRDTTSGQFIAEIDGLRFIAIFSVILFHLSAYVITKTGRTDYDPLVRLLSHGDIGVQLFFVISGAVIALPFAKGHLYGGRTPKLREYFSRRLTRLEPPYILNLIAAFVFAILLTSKKASDLLPHLLSSMGYLHNVTYGQMSTINPAAWSLEIELQFYVLAPLITSVFLIRSKVWRRLLLTALITLFSCLAFVVTGSPRYDLSILSQAQFFLTGFLLIDIYMTEWRQQPRKSFWWDGLSLLAWLAITLLLYQGRLGRLLIIPPIFVAYCAAFRGTLSNRFFRQSMIYTIGGMCYTIYLYHAQLLSPIVRLLLKTGMIDHLPLWQGVTILSVIVVPVVLLVTTMLFIFIEKPCMKKNWHITLWERIKLRYKNSTLRPELSE